MNYCTVAEIGDLDGYVAAIADLVMGMRGLTKPFVMSIIAACRLNVKERTPEPDINHLQATNPFVIQYGHDPWGVYGKPCWEEEVRRGLMSSKHCVCITDMVTHIMWAIEKACQGTRHSKDWMIYHDAPLLMTAQDCKDWMKTKQIGNCGLTFFDKWILPLHGMNDEIS
jgi:hypothetical protein